MISDWLRCPFCGDDADVTILASMEHVTVRCGHCESSEKLYHHEHDGWAGLHAHRPDGGDDG